MCKCWVYVPAHVVSLFLQRKLWSVTHVKWAFWENAYITLKIHVLLLRAAASLLKQVRKQHNNTTTPSVWLPHTLRDLITIMCSIIYTSDLSCVMYEVYIMSICFSTEFNVTGFFSLSTSGCTSDCNNTAGSILGAGFTISKTCCTVDLCNGASAAHVSVAGAVGAALLATFWSTYMWCSSHNTGVIYPRTFSNFTVLFTLRFYTLTVLLQNDTLSVIYIYKIFMNSLWLLFYFIIFQKVSVIYSKWFI